jgi:uncharacterized protein with von Willebrand factor type A (vWA) domain
LIHGVRLVEVALGFGRELRSAGLAVGMSDSLDFIRALGTIPVGRRADVLSASRAIHVRRREDIPRHDELFDWYWSANRGLAGSGRNSEVPHRGHSVDSGAGASSASGRDSQSGANGGPSHATPALVAMRRRYSREEQLRQRDFDRMTAEELIEAGRVIDRLAVNIERRPARRFDLHPHGTRLAPRPMLRRSVAGGGELVEWIWRRPRVVPRPVTLLVDVSGSMEIYARLLLRFAHSLRRVNRRVEVFVFGTRLTRVTAALAVRNVDEALARVAAEVADWSGGTRIGECLREYSRRWAGRIASTDGIVVVMSDGWDRGDPALVEDETARLKRRCRRLLWLNPLAGAAGFEPLAAGMAAAVRHVDMLLPAGSLNDLKGLVRLLEDTRWGVQALPHSA